MSVRPSIPPMDSMKHNSAPIRTKSKLSKTLHKLTHLKNPKIPSKTSSKQNPFCLKKPQNEIEIEFEESETESKSIKTRAAMEALISTLFATVSSVKAAYAELQLAQFPYDSASVQAADEALVRELKTLSELKYNFLRKKFDLSPPHVTLMLAEIQEQQSLMKMYEITMMKMKNELKTKESDVSGLRSKLEEIVSENKLLEKTINSSGQFSVLDCVRLSGEGKANPSDFNIVLNYTIKSIRSFVKLMVKEMEGSSWDIEAAAKSIQPDFRFPKLSHRCFVFESFVCREMFDGFDDSNFGLLKSFDFVEKFMKLKSANPIHFLKMYPHSGFGEFARAKYLRLIHPKMETSFWGNLNQRKMVNAGGIPETAFFGAFAEVAKKVWLLHCLAFSCGEEVGVFQVERGCRFSEVYMESVADESFADLAEDGGFRVGFTVVPGFMIGKTILQSQVYLLPTKTPPRR